MTKLKKILKAIGYAFILLLISFVVFFFWASAPNLDESEYAQLITLDQKNQPVKNDSVFSIVTYNIGYLSGMTNNLAVEKPKSLFDGHLKKVLQNFKELNADVIAFQEIDFNSKRSFGINQQNEIAKTGYNFIAQVINWDEKYLPFPYWPPSTHFGKVISGQSILSKFPLSNHQRIVLKRVKNAPFYRDAFYLERLAQVATVTLQNKEVVLINVHLEAFDEPTRHEQFKEVLTLAKKYQKTNPVILVGDFNSPTIDKNAAIHQLLNDDTLGCAAMANASNFNTFDAKHPSKRIDFIFYTKKDFVEVSSKVLSHFGETSDHLPIYLEFRFK